MIDQSSVTIPAVLLNNKTIESLCRLTLNIGYDHLIHQINSNMMSICIVASYYHNHLLRVDWKNIINEERHYKDDYA
jgi:hypothetical protein